MSSSNGNGWGKPEPQDEEFVYDYDGSGLSLIQKRILGVLADGHGHRPEELHACLSQLQGPVANILPHLTYIRKRLRLRGEDVLSQNIDGQTWYRLVRYIRKE